MYLDDQNSDQQSLSNKVVQQIGDNPAFYSSSIEGDDINGYVSGILDHEHADEIEIVALSIALSRPIVVIGPKGTIRNYDAATTIVDTANPIFVYYNGVNHYNAFTLDGEKGAGEILISLLSSTSTNTI